MACKVQTKHLCFMALLLTAVTLSAAVGLKPIPIVLDTDIGSDIDDAFALALVIASPELDLRAITTVSGDTQARARLGAKMLWVAGRRWADGFSSASLLPETVLPSPMPVFPSTWNTTACRSNGQTYLRVPADLQIDAFSPKDCSVALLSTPAMLRTDFQR